jgi:hypothetical protein
MCHENQDAAIYMTQGLPAKLSILHPILLRNMKRVGKNLDRSFKRNAVVPNVGKRLRPIPYVTNVTTHL